MKDFPWISRNVTVRLVGFPVLTTSFPHIRCPLCPLFGSFGLVVVLRLGGRSVQVQVGRCSENWSFGGAGLRLEVLGANLQV